MKVRLADEIVGSGSYIESAISNLGAANIISAGLRCSRKGKTQEGHGCEQGESHDYADWFVSILTI